MTTTTTIPTDLRAAFDTKVRRGIFEPVGRHLPDDVREDRLQDAVCQTWAMYERYAQRGELLDDAILVHSCRLRATDPSRHYVPCDGHQRKRDVFDPRNFLEGTVEVLRLGDFREVGEETTRRGLEEDEASLGFGLAEATSANPTRKILSAIDLTAWLSELPAEDRRMLELRASGYTLEETGDEVGVSISTVFTTCQRLGLALAEHAGIPTEPRTHKARKVDAPASTRRACSSTADTPTTPKGGLRKTSRARRSEAVPCAA